MEETEACWGIQQLTVLCLPTARRGTPKRFFLCVFAVFDFWQKFVFLCAFFVFNCVVLFLRVRVTFLPQWQDCRTEMMRWQNEVAFGQTLAIPSCSQYEVQPAEVEPFNSEATLSPLKKGPLTATRMDEEGATNSPESSLLIFWKYFGRHWKWSV